MKIALTEANCLDVKSQTYAAKINSFDQVNYVDKLCSSHSHGGDVFQRIQQTDIGTA